MASAFVFMRILPGILTYVQLERQIVSNFFLFYNQSFSESVIGSLAQLGEAIPRQLINLLLVQGIASSLAIASYA